MGLQMDRHPLGGDICTSGKSPGFVEFLVDGFGESQNCWDTVAIWVILISSPSLNA